MRDVLLLLLWVLSGVAWGTQPTGGYCIGSICFALFETETDFKGAQDICSQLHGHLMTVRSSVHHDSLSLLLGNTSGLHWIGLYLLKGCPDPTADLRGYQWVTTDTTSNFLNWAEASTPCSSPSPRCIFIPNDDKFQWHEDSCETPKSGFLCEYSFQDMCPGLKNTKVVYTTPFGFTVDDAATLPAGTIAEHPDEIKRVCASKLWMKAPWSCEIQRGGCEHKCTTNPENRPVCFCPPGNTVNPANDRTCEVSIDDPCLQLNCEHACYKHLDSFLCTCSEGFVLGDDMKSCRDFDECLDERFCPGDEEKCVNVHGDFQCVCKDGYKLNGGTCVDTDECASAPCEHMCKNKPGGYDCSCYEGYKVDPSSTDKCKRHCGKEECLAECDPNNKFQCFCPDGYMLDEREGAPWVCVDLDECESYTYCEQHCENLYGSYMCFCDRGFTLVDGSDCVKGADENTEDTTVTEIMEVVTVAPTHRPSAVSAGGLAGIIICTAFFILLAAFLIHHILCGKVKAESPVAFKAPEGPEA
ncbi:thrombomodulin-like [Eucyclogobius newberryi]|uniref:thrombomodulin-like n=1 Tax=Eucyclogobius newberryi TaxID=166745 RepID=UPI003B5C0DD8